MKLSPRSGLQLKGRAVQIFYCDHFELPLPPRHRFPMAKYRLLREAVARAGLVAPEDLVSRAASPLPGSPVLAVPGGVAPPRISAASPSSSRLARHADPSAVQAADLPHGTLVVPEPASDEQILRVHDAGYLERVKTGRLEAVEVRRLGFPWSPALVERSRRSVGGTIGACRSALATGWGVNLAGGTHHAFADRGEGFCVLNDVAIAARAMQAEGLARRVLVLDCDVHQGNGTAAIFRHDPTVFTFSIHGGDNFPLRKETSDLDVALPAGAGDDDYLAALDDGLARSLGVARADLAVYLAGADPYRGDRLGRLGVTREGLAARDRMVLAACERAGLPVAVVMAGGYAPVLEELVAIHLATVRCAVERWRRRAAAGAPRAAV